MNRATRILVVDDEPTVLELYAHLLRDANYEVWTATTGRAGLRCARERKPDVVLLDVMLPDLSGLEVCRQLKRDANLPDVFVALCSGGATGSTHKVDGLDSGADDYIVKPVTPEELLARVRTLARLHETTAALRASEQHFRRLVEMLPDAVALVDRQGRLRAANPQAIRMLGCSNEAQLLTQTLHDLLLPEDYERLAADMARPDQLPSTLSFDCTMRRQDAHTVPVELSIGTAGSMGGEPAGFVPGGARHY
jgi:PAS domain S-box-containing protein